MNKSNTFVVLFIAIVGSGALWFLFGSAPQRRTARFAPIEDERDSAVPSLRPGPIESEREEETLRPRIVPVANQPEMAVDESSNELPRQAAAAADNRPEAIDGSQLVMDPGTWRNRNTSTRMIPWEGKQLIFLTMENQPVTAKVVQAYTAKLNEGWSIYDRQIPGTPPLRKQVRNKPVMIATPGIYACGLGCGYIGATGIEVTSFYERDYQAFINHPDSFRNYYFYEMGRNWFIFGDGRYGMFRSSFAVHMRYVCMDGLKLKYVRGDMTPDTVLALEEKYRKSSDVDYYAHFVNNDGFALRQVLKDGNADRNTVYAGIMLKLEDHFGDTFLPRFYQALLQCPDGFDHHHRQGAEGQTRNWIVACSYAAQKDLAGVFAKQYHAPLDLAERRAFRAVSWKDDDAVKSFFEGRKN